MGVLSLYMLIGLAFAFTYGAIDRFGDEPFFADGGPATVSNCLYFSFTTLTTVGYGDFVAGTSLGHTLAVFEALIGQIYLVTVVSLIVEQPRPPGAPARDLSQVEAGAGAASAAPARLRARSAAIFVAAAVSGAARISPTAPNNAPPPIVTISTASGWMPSAAP